jgi:Zn finger protein HypA/HybF involved in hydrogenase expression
MDPITEYSADGRTVRVRFGPYSFTPAEAHEFAFDLSRAASHAENADRRHERHVNLLASCPLCVHQAGAQTDMLTQDDD